MVDQFLLEETKNQKEFNEAIGAFIVAYSLLRFRIAWDVAKYARQDSWVRKIVNDHLLEERKSSEFKKPIEEYDQDNNCGNNTEYSLHYLLDSDLVPEIFKLFYKVYRLKNEDLWSLLQRKIEWYAEFRNDLLHSVLIVNKKGIPLGWRLQVKKDGKLKNKFLNPSPLQEVRKYTESIKHYEIILSFYTCIVSQWRDISKYLVKEIEEIETTENIKDEDFYKLHKDWCGLYGEKPSSPTP